MNWKKRAEYEEQGEESGREEAADEVPFLPHVSRMSSEEYARFRQHVLYRGMIRARGLYQLRGRFAKVFATTWAMGYSANCQLLQKAGYLLDEEEEEE